MRHSNTVVKEFLESVSNPDDYKPSERKLTFVNPQNIIGINSAYNYPDILDDWKMRKLKQKIKSSMDWDNDDRKAWSLQLLELPNGQLVVDGNGNHRAVLSKELGLTKIKARVRQMIKF